MSKRCPTGNIAALPLEIRTGINLRLRDGWQLDKLAEWMFTKHKLAAKWMPKGVKGRQARDQARRLCSQELVRWFNGPYREWINTEAVRDKFVRMVDRVEELAGMSGEAGPSLVVRSLLLEMLENLRNDSRDAAGVARLADSFTKLTLGTRAADANDRKVAVLERKMEQAGRIVKDSALSPEQQNKRLKEIFGR